VLHPTTHRGLPPLVCNNNSKSTQSLAKLQTVCSQQNSCAVKLMK